MNHYFNSFILIWFPHKKSENSPIFVVQWNPFFLTWSLNMRLYKFLGFNKFLLLFEKLFLEILIRFIPFWIKTPFIAEYIPHSVWIWWWPSAWDIGIPASLKRLICDWISLETLEISLLVNIKTVSNNHCPNLMNLSRGLNLSRRSNMFGFT